MTAASVPVGPLTRRLLDAYRRSDAETRAAGRAWYVAAESLAIDLARRHGTTRTVAAAVLAVLSPRAQWTQNVTAAERACAAWRAGDDPAVAAAPFALGANCRKAAALLAGAPPNEIVGGRKVRAFWRNILGEQRPVTLDAWAMRAAFGADVPLSRARMDAAETAYRRAAERCGESPRDFQAIVWLAVRGVKPADAPGFRPTPEVK